MRTENEELRAALEAARAAAAADVLRADQAEERAALLAEREAAVEKNRKHHAELARRHLDGWASRELAWERLRGDYEARISGLEAELSRFRSLLRRVHEITEEGAAAASGPSEKAAAADASSAAEQPPPAKKSRKARK